MSQLVEEITPYQNSGEINFRISRKQEAMDAVRDYFMKRQKPEAFYDFDGYRLDYNDFWLNIRPSNTEPYLRFIAEAKSKSQLDEIVNDVTSIIKQFND